MDSGDFNLHLTPEFRQGKFMAKSQGMGLEDAEELSRHPSLSGATLGWRVAAQDSAIASAEQE
ncbi:MAG: hypothetical protein ACI8W8_003640 [Rhodothermales bacterium]|jgi:hypothetical protein